MNTIIRSAGKRRRLRVAVVTETFPPEINGVARTAGLMIDALRSHGHEMMLVRPRQKSDADAARDAQLLLVKGVPIPKYGNLQMGFVSRGRLAREWREWQPDLVHVVTEGPLGWAAVAVARRLDIPISSDFHTNFHSYSGHYGFGWIAALITRYMRALHNRCECTLVPTGAMKALLEGLGFERVGVVGRGVDTQLFSPARRNDRMRAQWGCRGDETVALYVGRLAPEKNIDLFIETVKAMRALDPALRVVLVGDGPLGEKLRAQHPGFVFAGMRVGEDLAAHYASADMFLFPSLTETFGNVTLEAMASGLALVSYDYGAAREHARHGTNALLVPPGQPDAFLRAAESIVLDRARQKELGRNARDAVRAVSWESAFGDLERELLRAADAARVQPLPEAG